MSEIFDSHEELPIPPQTSHRSHHELNKEESMIQLLVKDYESRIMKELEHELNPRSKAPFAVYFTDNNKRTVIQGTPPWITENAERFLIGTPNAFLVKMEYLSELGFITCLQYSADGDHILVGHSSGLIQMRHGKTGTVICTLRPRQFPPKPVYSLQYSDAEERVCYATSSDGSIYRIDIPNITPDLENPPIYCITADPALECLSMQFYGTPGISSYATAIISQRYPALSLGITADQNKMVVGYEDTSVKVYDMETLQAETTYKVHKMRMKLMLKKLQRSHSGQVCALRCHPQNVYQFASAAWDNTLRIWDVRCKVGCVMTFEGVNVCSDSIDLNRNHCIAGSWQPTGALTVWDLVARRKLTDVTIQNRRPDVDGEYIYACRFWRSADYNRKGKYAIIGGSGTGCVEVINLHNRYIACSYPSEGAILAVTSHGERIAYGGTSSVFTIVTFRDPKHEKYEKFEQERFRRTIPDEQRSAEDWKILAGSSEYDTGYWDT
ncbi:uncharacterized protein LOC105389620 isoform X1 [Plutella xylostella]|uniref:uncharacterized protein LOC105389620 isoform X1 n=1 Tax=Plutella xylostella TaxID=51655 RepID=UPI00203308DB|nr:uncharacterized protein LOC105389620 isoform X1 [Plutella xylostella]